MPICSAAEAQMSTHDDAFTAEAKSLVYTFRAKAGTKPTWTPRWGFVTDEPHFDPRFKIGGQFGGWFYGVRAYGGHGWEFGGAETKRGPEVNEYSDFAGVLGTGVYVTGVAGTSINNVGVYGQTGEVPDLPFPVPYYVRAGAAAFLCQLRSMVENRFAFLTVSHQFDILRLRPLMLGLD